MMFDSEDFGINDLDIAKQIAVKIKCEWCLDVYEEDLVEVILPILLDNKR